MAGPVAHIILALGVLARNNECEQYKKKFIIGTSFPDIRYLEIIKRERTHNNNATLETLNCPTIPFRAGMDFHSLVDEIRLKYMQDHNVYKMLPKVQNIDTYIKLVEDRILYNQCKNWKKIIQYFGTVVQEERKFNIPRNQVNLWHKFIIGYCQKKPTLNRSLNLFIKSRWPSLPSSIRNLILLILKKSNIISDNIITQLEKNETLKNMIINFYDNFEFYVKKYKVPEYSGNTIPQHTAF